MHVSFSKQTLKIAQRKNNQSHQGNGLGGLLISAAEVNADSTSSGHGKVILKVLETNNPPERFQPIQVSPCACSDGNLISNSSGSTWKGCCMNELYKITFHKCRATDWQQAQMKTSGEN